MQTATCTMTETREQNLNIVIMGLPGCGKGTQSQMIADKYSLTHISSGDMLRAEMKKDTKTARDIKRHMEDGTLFSDELVNSVMVDNVPEKNFILDGYPRKISQVNTFPNINLVIFLTLNEDEAVRRIMGRNQGRKDDTEDAIKVRLATFREKTKPVIDYYVSSGMLREIDAGGSPDEVFKRVVDIIEKTKD
ncbi:adenylate kinase [Pancytospora epiphaga]|nr:adenylate kinase [Pancytospora epiphaga]